MALMQPKGPSKRKLDQQKKSNLYSVTEPFDLLDRFGGSLGDDFEKDLKEAESKGFTFTLLVWQNADQMLNQP